MHKMVIKCRLISLVSIYVKRHLINVHVQGFCKHVSGFFFQAQSPLKHVSGFVIVVTNR